MDARWIRVPALLAVLLVSMALASEANFVVETSDPALATQFAQAAEKYRHDLAIEWLGQAMPNWGQPCTMTVQVGPNLGAGGATTFVFDHGEVFGWRMTIQGSAERLLDSVIPHEVTHMIFASYFRRPLPRWADEGGATSVECSSEKRKHRGMLVQFLRTNRGIAFSQMFAMTEYPRDVMPLYAQAYSLTEYLIMQGGRRKYVEFLSEGMQTGEWPAAIHRHYGIADLGTLQNTWVAWVGKGFPETKRTETAIAARSTPSPAVTLSATAQPPATALAAQGTSLAASGRSAPPEPNLLYRVSDKGSAANSAAKTTGAKGATAMSAASEAVAPLESTAAVVPPAQIGAPPLPTMGWRPVGPPPKEGDANAPPPPLPPPPTLAPVPAAEPTQVTRPPTMDPSREVILEWAK